MRVGAAAASLGALLALIAGVGRTTLAMAREGDVPRWLAAVHPRFLVPHRAELVLAVVVSVLVLLTDLRGAIALLVVRGAAVLRDREPRGVHAAARSSGGTRRGCRCVGLVGCVGLVVTLPVWGVVAGVIVVAVGVALRFVRLADRDRD